MIAKLTGVVAPFVSGRICDAQFGAQLARLSSFRVNAAKVERKQ